MAMWQVTLEPKDGGTQNVLGGGPRMLVNAGVRGRKRGSATRCASNSSEGVRLVRGSHMRDAQAL